MLIVPFIHKVVNCPQFDVNVIKLLTIGGKTIWKEKNSLHLDNDILEPNDIFRKGEVIQYDKELKLCEVDEKTNIDDFFKWDEVSILDATTFCWKTYYIISDKHNKLAKSDIKYSSKLLENLWLDIPNTEMIDKYKIKDILYGIMHKTHKTHKA